MAKYYTLVGSAYWYVLKRPDKAERELLGIEDRNLLQILASSNQAEAGMRLGLLPVMIHRLIRISRKEASKAVQQGYYPVKKLVVDFDKTLFPANSYPEPSKPRWIHKLVAAYVRYKYKRGWVIILSTMREDNKGLPQAKAACERYNIPIDLYNENYPPDVAYWGESRKIGATVSIDDTQIGFIGWMLRRFG